MRSPGPGSLHLSYDRAPEGSLKFTMRRALACTALAAVYGAALADDGALAPLQVPAKSLPVPADVSPELQRIIAAPRNPTWNVLWKTGEEWRTAADAQAAKPVQALPAVRHRPHVTVHAGK